jgi:hypothetical protein
MPLLSTCAGLKSVHVHVKLNTPLRVSQSEMIRHTLRPNANGSARTGATPIATEASQVALRDDLLSYQAPSDDKPAAQSNLRLAKIKFANPGDL